MEHLQLVLDIIYSYSVLLGCHTDYCSEAAFIFPSYQFDLAVQPSFRLTKLCWIQNTPHRIQNCFFHSWSGTLWCYHTASSISTQAFSAATHVSR